MKLSHINKFFSAAASEKRTLMEAVFWLVFFRVVLFCFPFRWIVPYLGKSMKDPMENFLDEKKELQIREIVQAIKKTAPNLPWQCRCLVQACAAKIMLQRKKIRGTLYLGVKKEESIEAHAWLIVNGIFITGKTKGNEYNVISYYT